MRKSLISAEQRAPADVGPWLDLERAASVEVSSEDPAHPIEAALVPPVGRGWRAGAPGIQTVRLRFDEPQHVRRILIEVHEGTTERTQEMTISCSTTGRKDLHVVRQRWNFSPRGSVHELEDYRVDLHGVTALEVTIQPDVGDHPGAHASITQLRVEATPFVRGHGPGEQ